ncbi:hypothetical protein [Candidatus Leptofilum sp.]|uniref:hypothetical protein n=1 Tax=Candidatus Leptofilum sp. TaxID=3241576 RepID=UPI003B5BF389
MISKDELDNILALYKAQPVGNGYIEVIVKRENVRQLIAALILGGIHINFIAWWEYVKPNTKSKGYGMGGPPSRYYDGWFSELCIADDELETTVVEDIMKVIENKEITLGDGRKINYKQEESLTPALWLVVPKNWKSQ